MDVPRFKSIARPAPDMLWLGFFYFTISCGHLIWRATIYNFGLEEYDVKPEEISYLFSIAALPGLLTIALGFLVQRITLVAILISSYFSIGAGLIVMGQSANWQTVWGGVLLLNLGFAVIYPMAGCFCLNRSRADRAAVTLGNLKSLGPAAAFATIPLMTFLLPLFNIRTLLLMTGYVTIVVGMVITPYASRFVVMRRLQRRFKFRRQLLPFYTLNFLNGSRSALFKTFVIFFPGPSLWFGNRDDRQHRHLRVCVQLHRLSSGRPLRAILWPPQGAAVCLFTGRLSFPGLQHHRSPQYIDHSISCGFIPVLHIGRHRRAPQIELRGPRLRRSIIGRRERVLFCRLHHAGSGRRAVALFRLPGPFRLRCGIGLHFHSGQSGPGI